MPEFYCKASIEIEVTLNAKSKKQALEKLENLELSVSVEGYDDVLDWAASSDHNPINWEVSKSEPMK